MKSILLAIVLLGNSTTADTIPAEFGVCVRVTDRPRIRLDSHWPTYEDAVARKNFILANGWTTEGDEYDREDFYPVHSIIKVTIDPTLINQPSCVAPK